jgi:hypothetical protein
MNPAEGLAGGPSRGKAERLESAIMCMTDANLFFDPRLILTIDKIKQ